MRQVSITEKRAFVLVLIAFGIAFVYLMQPVLIPVILASIIVILLYPTYLFFVRVFKGRARLASFITTLVIFLTLILPFGVVIALLVDQTIHFISTMNLQEVLSPLQARSFYHTYVMPFLTHFEEIFRLNLDLQSMLTRVGTGVARYIYNFSPKVLAQTATFFFGFFIMHVSIYFLFLEGKNLARMLFEISPLETRQEEQLTIQFKNMIYATVYGYLLTALVQAILATIGFQIAGVSAPLVFGTLTFFMSLVPIIGATSVWLPLSIWLFLKGNTGWGIFLLIYGFFIISGIDNIIKPLIMRERAKVHILLIFFSLLGGLKIFGPLGILFGPVITAMFLACLRLYRSDFLSSEVSRPS